MESSSWGPHPSLEDALTCGLSFDDWLAGRVPVVSYARMSSDRHGLMAATSRQHVNNGVAASRLGWAVVYRYTDNGVTAADPNVIRLGFQRLVRDIFARRTEDGFRVCGVVAVEEERIARLPDDLLLVYRALAVEEDGRLYWVDADELVDVFGETACRPDAVVAGEAEVDRIRRRRLRSVRDRASEGRVTGGARRFGWLGPDPAAGRSTNTLLDPYESMYLRKVIDMALAGTAWTAMVDWLTEESVPSVLGGHWTVATVQAMVTNPAVCGYRMVDGALVKGGETGEPVVGNWETVATPYEWQVLIQRCDRWYSLDRARRSHKQTDASRPRGNAPEGSSKQERRALTESTRKYLLSGFLRCGYADDRQMICGYKMGGHPPRGTNRHPSYRCSAPKCRKVGRRADLVDACVEATVLQALEERYAGVRPDQRPYPGEAQLTVLSACRAPTKLVSMQIRDLERDREDFYAQQRERNLLARFTGERWASFDIRQKRLAIAAVVESVVVYPIPKGRPRNAPFDPDLVEVVLRSEH